MSVLICGSLAYDTIMVFPDRFRNHILPEQVHILNVAFLVPEMRREYGGCAGNIAYNLKMLGGSPLPMGTVGEDFGPYASRLAELGIPTEHVHVVEGTYTAQAFITSDLDDNQITAFHPGAMAEAHRNRVDAARDATLGIVAPDGRQGMIEHAAQFAHAGIPFLFDPGQGLPMFDGAEIETFLEQASWVAANDYESHLMAQRTGLTVSQMAERVSAFIVTRGAEGSVIHAGGKHIDIPAVEAISAVDPTGCGDAYRAGLLYGLARDMDWETTGRIASLLGSIKVARHGTQNHRFTPGEFLARYEEEFGHRFD